MSPIIFGKTREQECQFKLLVRQNNTTERPIQIHGHMKKPSFENVIVKTAGCVHDSFLGEEIFFWGGESFLKSNFPVLCSRTVPHYPINPKDNVLESTNGYKHRWGNPMTGVPLAIG